MASRADGRLHGGRGRPLPPGLAPEHLIECLARHRLSIVWIHGDLPAPANIDWWEELARGCHCSKVSWHGWPRDPRFDSVVGLRDLIAACNGAGDIARGRGLRFGMHDHWWEPESVAGETPNRPFHESLDTEIFWRLDVYRARTAGADPTGVLLELGARIGSIHWKDGPAVQGEPMTALGWGIVDLPRVLHSLVNSAAWIIELDKCATEPMEAVGRSLAYLIFAARRAEVRRTAASITRRGFRLIRQTLAHGVGPTSVDHTEARKS